MEDFGDRYGSRFIKLVDSRGSGKEFEFDQVLLMPTAAGYRALVEQARIEINPRIMKYLSRRWSEGAIENLSFFAMAAAIYARSVSDPPVNIDVGRVLLRTVAFCKCIKIPRDIAAILGCLKRYIATGKAINCLDATGVQGSMEVKVDPGMDFVPAASC